MTRLKPNTCDAPGCNLTIPRAQLMCRAHWFGTPTQLRRVISDSWKAKRIYAGPRCELFARAPRAEWDVWGNQTNRFADG